MKARFFYGTVTCMIIEPTNEQKLHFRPRANRLGISMLVLFGSAATQSKKPEDVDVAVFLTPEAQERASADFGIQSKIIEAVGDFIHVSSDILDTVFIGRHTAPLLAYHIARDGALLFGSERDFMRFRLLAVKRHYDSAKLYDARERYLQQVYA